MSQDKSIISEIAVSHVITLFLFTGCPELFKDMEYVIIRNESDYVINVFVNNEHKNTVEPGITYEFGLYTNIKYTLTCYSVQKPYQWGPIEIILEKGKPYTWVIENPPEPTLTPTPESTPEPEPTPTPTPIPQADITINNNTDYEVDISISNAYKGEIAEYGSRTYTVEIGNHILEAYAGELQGHWQENIELLEEGYIWNLEINTELYPAEGCRVWNFEYNVRDQNGISTWDNAVINIGYGDAKFGIYGITRFMPEYIQPPMLIDYEYVPYGNDFSTAVWIKVKETDPNWTYARIIGIGRARGIYICLAEQTATTFKIRLSINTHSDYVAIFSDEQLANEWIYIAFTYDSSDNTAYLIVNDNVYSTDSNLDIRPSSTLYDFEINAYNKPYNHTLYTCLDELFYSATTIDPVIFVNHYNHNVPWGSEYIP